MAFVKNGGKKGAALHALSTWIDDTEFFNYEALMNAVQSHKHADKLMKAIHKPVLNQLIFS